MLLTPPLRGELDGGVEAAVLEISPTGARVEHRQFLSPGGSYTLALPVAGDAACLRLPCRVIWTWVHRNEPGEGETGCIYHSGLEFLDLPPDVGRDLAAYLLGGIAAAHSGPLHGTLEPPPY